MVICDRCRKNPGKYNKYVGKKSSIDLCGSCYKELEHLNKAFEDIEELFLSNKDVIINYKEKKNG